MPASTPQREFALKIVQQLRAAGFEALWAGGCVRDELLGVAPKDYDVATNATPNEIRDLFGRRRTLPIGAAFGVVTVLGPRAAGQLDVATFRTDAAYSDGRHPDSVTFSDAEHDAQRRDFTINGLFFDPVAEQVVDYVAGQEDLRARLVRAIGDPRLRLAEDKLRMLRAVRFAATFDFEIDPATMRAIREMAPQLRTVSAERIGMELRRMIVHESRTTAIQLLRESKLLTEVIPEFAGTADDTFAEIDRILPALEEPSLPLALAALLYTVHRAGDEAERVGTQASVDTNAEDAEVCHNYVLTGGAWRLAPACAAQIARRLRFTKKEGERTVWLLDQLGAIANSATLPWPALQRIITHEGADELLALRGAIAGEDDPALAFCRERLAWPVERLNPPPLVGGGDLIGRGYQPGPRFSELLTAIRDAQLHGEISTRDEALALADRLRAAGETLP